MKLGAFSVSLNVKDLTASKEFYEALGFSVFAGEMQKGSYPGAAIRQFPWVALCKRD